MEDRLTPATPVVLSINPATPTTPITSATSVTYAVTFGEAVNGVDAADFKVTTNGTVQAAAPVVISGSGATYTVKINGIAGSGELRLDLVDNDTIIGGGGPLGGAGANNGSFQGRTYSILQTSPSVLSINRTAPSTPITNASSVSYTVAFSTPVTGVDAADFGPLLTIGTVAAASTQVTPVSSTVYTVTVSGITGNGALGVNLIDNGTIRDADGRPLSNWSAPVSFQGQQTYAVGTAPGAVLSSDLNGDAKVDLVVLNRNANSLSVLLGNGDGRFQSQQSFSAGALPRGAALGDVNGDGKPDVAVASNNGTISVLLGNGNGTFQGQVTYAAGAGARGIAMGDINGDGKPDLAAANYTANSISVFLGNGNGSFQVQKTFAAGNRPVALTLGEVNGDGKADVAVANYLGSSVSVLLGNGDGAFQGQQTFATGNGASSAAIGDVNGDGKPDMVVANYSVNSLSVLLGNGNGTFQGQQSFASGALPRSAVLGDVNGDGKLDIANTNFAANTASVLLGNGNGTFQAPQNFASAGSPRALLLTDLNADGKPDLAVANSDNSGGGNSASVLIGNRSGNFAGQTYSIDHAAPTVAIAPVSPDPRLTAVGVVAISFNEAVQNVDITDFTLTRGGVSVPLTAAMFSGVGSQYALDLTTATSAGAAPAAGSYVLTLNTSDIKDLASNALTTGASDAWQINDQTAPTVAIAPVSPDPRLTAVGIVAISFNKAVQNVDITDFTITRGGVNVPLTAAMLSGVGSQYALDLTTATSAGANPVAGSYVLTLNASDIKDLAGNALATGASDAWQINDQAAPTVAIAPVSPDPRLTAVGVVAISFNEAVQNVDINDFTLTRGGVNVPLTAAMLSGGGSQYALDLATATFSSGNPVAGIYVLTLKASDIKDLAGNALAMGASDAWQINPTPTTTTVTATPNTSTSGTLVTFTATIAPSPGNNGMVTFKDNGVAIPNGAGIAVTGGVATLQISTLTAGTHMISAEYSGSASLAASTSNPLNFVVTALQPTVAIAPVSPDPRLTAVGVVAISFNVAVQNVDITDFTLTRGGVNVPLTASMLSGGGSQYALDLTTATSAGANAVVGSYVLTLNASDIKDLAGNALATGASDTWQINPTPTTTTVTAAPNASTGGTLVTFTATIAPSPGNNGTVIFKDNGVALSNGAVIAVTGGVATLQISTLTAGTHAITAEYSGSAGLAASTSTPLNFVVTASQPQLVSVTPNANIAGLAGAQRSRIASMVVVFNQPVQLDNNAITVALHANNVAYDGALQATGYGSLPTSLNFATSDNVTWVVTFIGNTEGGPDGINSLKDGVYDFRIDAAKVHPKGVPTLNLTTNSTTTFHRLFGDTGPPATPQGGTAGVDFQAVLNTGDNLAFRATFNTPAAYKAYFDFNGDGLINTGDNLPFRSRFNKALTWKV